MESILGSSPEAVEFGEFPKEVVDMSGLAPTFGLIRQYGKNYRTVSILCGDEGRPV